MGDDRCRRHAKRLEGCDLLALRGDKPAQGDIEEERGDGEEDIWNGRRSHPLLVELVLEKAVRRLIAALESAERPIRFEKPIDLVDCVLGVGSWSERNDRIVEGAFHREG